MKKVPILGLLLLLLLACNTEDVLEETAVPPNTPSSSSSPTSEGMGMGMGSNMMARHMATIPEEYAGLNNPIEASEASLANGGELYTTYCATCHGDGGMGDGPAAATMDPAPAAIAHTSQMLGDDYLFWRISEGGQAEPFNSAMPAWGSALNEQARWDIINYLRALGHGTAPDMGGMMGGATYDPTTEANHQTDMLAQAVEQGVLTQSEADLFAEIHALLEANMTRGMQMQGRRGQMQGQMGQMQGQMQGNMSQMQIALLAQLVDSGTITQADADQFNEIHARLLEAGLMQ